MSAEKPPEWLPSGWIMEVRSTRSGSKYRYYASPGSRCTFCSKEEVMHYLDNEKAKTNNQQLVVQRKDSAEWLPPGWIMEIKCRKTGATAGQKYKCYFDPSTSSRFYSKEDVLRHLKDGKQSSSTTSHKRSPKTNLDNVVAQFEYSPDGLPHGWIKETKFRKSNLNKSGIRRDPYYTDPVTGYVFRSRKDCFHYISTGEISKHAFKPKNRQINNLFNSEESSPPVSAENQTSGAAAVGHCATRLFPNSDKQITMQTNGPAEKPQEPVASSASTPCGGVADVITENKASVEFDTESRNGNTEQIQSATKDLGVPVKQLKGKRKMGNQVSDSAIREPLSNEPLILTYGVAIDPSDNKHTEPVDKKILELTSRPSKRSQWRSEVEILIEDQQHLGKENNNLPLPENNLLEVETENITVPEGMQSEPVPEKSLPEAQNSDKGIKTHGSCRTKSQKAITLPLRISKQLAMLKADRMPNQSTSSLAMVSNTFEETKLVPSTDIVLSEKTETEFVGLLTDGRDPAEENKPTEGGPELPSTLPFAEFWTDPCIEFAFRTLTSDIPEFEDCLAVQNYFDHQQPISVKSPRADGSVSSALGAQDSISKSVNHVQKQPSKVESSCSFVNALVTGEKRKKDNCQITR